MHALETTNRLLNLLAPKDLAQLAPLLQRVDLPLRTVLQEPSREIQYIHFLESGLGSVVAVSGDAEIEVAHVGAEGMTGLQVLSGVSVSSHRLFIQIPGVALRIPRESFLDVLDESPSARALFLHYKECFTVQLEQTALVNGKFNIEQRLARWLLMCEDRLGSPEIAITHEFLALMLGVRRAGVTTALHTLEGDHLIKSVRGLVVVKDRAGLEALAGASYGFPEATYARFVNDALSTRARAVDGSPPSAIH
jgi:CRP-like cAMP-binding protein